MLRKSLKYPPFCDIIMLGVTSEDEIEVQKIANLLHEFLKQKIINENAKIVDYLPRWLVQTIKILYFIFGGIIALGSIIAICQKGTWISKLSVIFVLLSLLIPLLWIF